MKPSIPIRASTISRWCLPAIAILVVAISCLPTSTSSSTTNIASHPEIPALIRTLSARIRASTNPPSRFLNNILNVTSQRRPGFTRYVVTAITTIRSSSGTLSPSVVQYVLHRRCASSITLESSQADADAAVACPNHVSPKPCPGNPCADTCKYSCLADICPTAENPIAANLPMSCVSRCICRDDNDCSTNEQCASSPAQSGLKMCEKKTVVADPPTSPVINQPIACSVDSECPEHQWCGPTSDPNVSYCRDFQQCFGSCEAFSLPEDYARCDNGAGVTCYKHQPEGQPELPDAPGVCLQQCQSTADCAAVSGYCGGDHYCLQTDNTKKWACIRDTDCLNADNPFHSTQPNSSCTASCSTAFRCAWNC